MCSTYTQALLPAYLLFLIHDVQEPERLDYQKGDQAASSISGLPLKNFDDVDLYTPVGLAVNFVSGTNFAFRHLPLFEDQRGLAPRCGGGYIPIFFPL